MTHIAQHGPIIAHDNSILPLKNAEYWAVRSEVLARSSKTRNVGGIVFKCHNIEDRLLRLAKCGTGGMSHVHSSMLPMIDRRDSPSTSRPQWKVVQGKELVKDKVSDKLVLKAYRRVEQDTNEAPPQGYVPTPGGKVSFSLLGVRYIDTWNPQFKRGKGISQFPQVDLPVVTPDLASLPRGTGSQTAQGIISPSKYYQKYVAPTLQTAAVTLRPTNLCGRTREDAEAGIYRTDGRPWMPLYHGGAL